MATNKWDDEFTSTAVEVFTNSTDIAAKLNSSDVKPLHVLLALLGVKDVEHPQQWNAPEHPTLMWTIIRDIEQDPVALTEDAIKRCRKDDSLRPPANVIFASSHNSHSTKNLNAPTKTNKISAFFQRSREPSRDRRAPTPPPIQPEVERPDRPIASDAFVAIIKRARQLRGELGDLFIGPYHLLLALSEDVTVKGLFTERGLPSDTFVNKLKARRPAKITTAEDNSLPYLSKYSTDMTLMAREGKLNEIIGRDDEIRRVIQILCRRTKNSAVLLGEPGVGKTAVAEGLAHRIAANQVPEHLKGTIYSLDLGALFAGAGKGEYEQRVKGVIDDVMRSQQSSNPAILFIDELHLITVGKGSGGQSSGMDAANLLKPALARGQFRCIGATTLSEYREHIEKDGALERRFAPVMVEEPKIEEATTILRGIRERYEQHHHVWIMDQAIVTAVNLAHRYLTARRLPDSAVDLMDEACASARVAQDMKPEAIDSAEQEIAHLKARISALERDGHPDDDIALEDAKKTRISLEAKKDRLEIQQEAIRRWWEAISVRRKLIQEKKVEVEAAKAKRDKSSRISSLEQELKGLRDGLVKLENDGPDIAISDTELSFSGKFRQTFTRTSPDIITPESIAAVVERATKIPVSRLLSSDKGRLLGLEDALMRQVVGQPEAVKAVTHAIQLSRTGLGNSNRPIASLLFTGPSGTGKTLLSKALAQELFGQSTAMVRIDGSEYAESHSISRLIGSPPGYVGYNQGGQLTEYVRRTPYCIVLLDEIEKTAREFLTLFLQVLDEGRLTDGQGRLVDFRNCVIIMTSNIGAQTLSAVTNEVVPDSVRSDVIGLFKQRGFPVEFLNRIDEIVMFRSMSEKVMRQILDNHLEDVRQREGMKKLRLSLDDQVKKWLIKTGISREYGARPLARVVQRELLNPLSQRLLENTIREGDAVIVRLSEDQKGLYVEPNYELEDGGGKLPASTSARGRTGRRHR